MKSSDLYMAGQLLDRRSSLRCIISGLATAPGAPAVRLAAGGGETWLRRDERTEPYFKAIEAAIVAEIVEVEAEAARIGLDLCE